MLLGFCLGSLGLLLLSFGVSSSSGLGFLDLVCWQVSRLEVLAFRGF